MKDPRELQGNKQRQKEVVADIVEFCNEHDHDITVKEMMSYSTSVYKEGFYCQILLKCHKKVLIITWRNWFIIVHLKEQVFIISKDVNLMDRFNLKPNVLM